MRVSLGEVGAEALSPCLEVRVLRSSSFDVKDMFQLAALGLQLADEAQKLRANKNSLGPRI